MTCNRQMIYIYRGDDTDWNNEQFVTVNVTSGSSSIDLSTMSAVFTLGNFTRTYSLAEGSFQVSLSSEVTQQFPYGPLMGSIKILDSQHRIKTATTDIPFYVTSEVITLQNQNLVIEVPGVSINVTVGGTLNYNDLLDKPSINGVTVEGSNTAEHYNLANKTDLDAHIANKNNPHEVTKAQVGLSNVDNTSDANKPISNATANALAGKLSKSGDTMTGNLTMATGTSIVFPNYTIKENQAGNPIIGDGNGNGMVILADGHGAAFFTNGGSSYTEVVSQKDVKSTYSPTGTYPVNGTAVASAISTKQDNLTPAQLNAVNSGIDSTKVSQIETNRQNIASEVTNRQNADNGLQTQIDALSAASDVTDIVGTYAELQAYDTSKLKDNDIIKVLEDSTHDNASSYYRWSTHTSTFTYIGSEGPYTTPAQLQAGLNTKQDVISDLSTIRSGADAGATAVQPSSLATVATTGSYTDLLNKPTIPTVNNATITLTQGGTTKGYFTLNQSSDATIALDAGGSSSAPSLTWFTGKTGSSFDTELDLSNANLIKVYKNGILLEENVSGSETRLFSASGRNYVELPNFYNFGSADSWQISGHLKTPANVSNQRIVSNRDYDFSTPVFTTGLESENWAIYLSFNGYSWYGPLEGGICLPNTEYDFRFGFTGNRYYLDTKIDGESEWTTPISQTNSSKIYSNESRSIISLLNTPWQIGYPFTGDFNLSKFKIILDNIVEFDGETAIASTDYINHGCTETIIPGSIENDYYISSSIIYFSTPLEATDKITVEVF